MSFIELEYKYKADEVGLADFRSLMNSLPVKKKVDISSWDIYYTKNGEPEKFQRFRNGSTPELTKKRKVNNNNNWERVEVDLPLDPKRVNEEIVSKYVSIDGYAENFRIYKTCFIYWLDNINFVYYIVYDENLREKDRFIEVEVNKEKVSDLEDASSTLKEAESILVELGISPQNRLKKSLFEMFVK